MHAHAGGSALAWLLFCGGGVAIAQSPEPPSSSTALPLNPLALSVPVAPQPVAGSDGRTHLTWEVVATNLAHNRVKVRSIAVFGTGETKARLEYVDGQVAAHLSPIADFTRPVDEIASSMTAVAWLDLALDPGATQPASVETRQHVEGEGIAAEDAGTRVVSAVDATPPRVLQAPLAGPLWAALEGCCDLANHHRRGLRSVDGHLVLPERYAIDFIQLDRKANLYRGSDVNEHNFAFGKPVLAVADATVVDVYDELADIAPREKLPPPSLPKAGGNHVILDLGGGVFAMYGHLKSGSIRVHAGDRVRAGEAFAQLGNNGNSDLPHLHFQLMDSRNFALAQGLPFVFERFDLVGRIDPVTEKIVASGKPSARKNVLPLTFSVVNFPIPRK
jgi:hypothetical protein